MRTMTLQRKPAVTIAVGVKPKPSVGAATATGETGADGMAICPECGCCFDDATGDVIPEGDPRYPADAGEPEDEE